MITHLQPLLGLIADFSPLLAQTPTIAVTVPDAATAAAPAAQGGISVALSHSFVLIGAVAALGLSAIGSVLGVQAAGQSAIGAWKKCYMAKKPAPFLIAAFVGAPLSQTIYGCILMGVIQSTIKAGQVSQGWLVVLIAGILAGTGIGLSAYVQGRAAAAGADVFGESGEGFTNFLAVLGMIETVALFVMIFTILLVTKS